MGFEKKSNEEVYSESTKNRNMKVYNIEAENFFRDEHGKWIIFTGKNAENKLILIVGGEDDSEAESPDRVSFIPTSCDLGKNNSVRVNTLTNDSEKEYISFVFT